MKAKQLLGTLAIAMIGAVLAVFLYIKFGPEKERVVTLPAQPVTMANMAAMNGANVNFVLAAKKSVEAVVHVKTEAVSKEYNPIMEFFYGNGSSSQPIVGFGSGVILSADGYIVTNNHVIEGSDKISVTLNDKREFEAQLIGHDPSTDLALLKIKADNMFYISFGNSDSLQVGEWVLAVGNPFNLTSTVTAGIVSAKGKNIGIIQDQYRMESFIQTDAAVNRGNSGGALVDIYGDLVGINTAIISPSGGYAGISFAIPSAIVQKVVKDLIEYGVVQRAILGVSIQDVTSALATEKKLDKIEGVYITEVRPESGAKEAGIEPGDLILTIDGNKVNSSGELQALVSRYRPNDKIKVEIKRNGKLKQFEVTLRNLQGKTNYLTSDTFDKVLGARFEEVSSEDKTKLGIKYGIKVAELGAGKLRAEGVGEGFIITQINNTAVYTVDDLKNIIEKATGGIYIEGIYPNGVIHYYAFGLN